jgi:glycosyltransferase involved in cell wall biosynthesis
MGKRILFLVPYPLGEAPSQRFRFEQYFPALEQAGFTYHVLPFLTKSAWQNIYKTGKIGEKGKAVLFGFLIRLLGLRMLKKFDMVFIHREAAFVGPPIIEWIIAKWYRKPIIYDFDDAIWLPATSDAHSWIGKLKDPGKVRRLCKWSKRVSCGNQYLADYASQFNEHVVLNPTTIDLSIHDQTKQHQDGKIVIGWTGTHTTIHHLELIVPIIEKLEQEIDMEFRVISNQPPNWTTRSLNYIEWNKDTEIEDLMGIDIGLMPMYDNEWTRGKCGFKILQYQSLGIPAIASPVGVNPKMIQNGKNGFLGKDAKEWEYAIRKLAGDAVLRSWIGKAGQEQVKKHYSVDSNKSNFLKLFQ